MITFIDSPKESMNKNDKCLDSQLWHACAGGMVQMPALHSKVYYFPQGHAEHAQGAVDFGTPMSVPALILCRVLDIKFMADPETDEVFAKIQLLPVLPNEPDFSEDDRIGLGGAAAADTHDKPASFAKTLTQSDANNGGGFSVPRYCAETIFPRLDYSADPPVQTILAKDVHNVVWKFRHIYRGTPRRHLLTTGWSTFVNQKKLVAGDSIVFLRTDNGDLCVGIRRAKRLLGGVEPPSGWNPPGGNGLTTYGVFSVFSREEESKLLRGGGNGGSMNSCAAIRGRGRLKAESVIEAASLAANRQPFEVVYYPRASTPEFCVKAAAVRSAMRTQWCPGMRFKMAFETEDSSRISWFMGTISAVQLVDPVRWPNSPWRLLQVNWDEPDLLQNVKRVSPWLVELVSHMPAIHLTPFSPPRKKLCIPQHPEFPLEGQFPTPVFPGNLLGRGGGPLCGFANTTPAGIQGARHAQLGISLPDPRLNKLQSGLLHPEFLRLDHNVLPPKIFPGLTDSRVPDDISCVLTIGTPHSMKKPEDKKAPQLVLFGRPILTEQQISLSNFGGEISPRVTTGNSSSEGNPEKAVNISEGSDSTNHYDLSRNSFSLGSEIGHCKVYMGSEDIGRTLDLSIFGSYEELYGQLAAMFGMKKHELASHLLYRDVAGVVKLTGNEPFSEFMKTARRLMILTGAGGDNLGRLEKPLVSVE